MAGDLSVLPEANDHRFHPIGFHWKCSILTHMGRSMRRGISRDTAAVSIMLTNRTSIFSDCHVAPQIQGTDFSPHRNELRALRSVG